MAVRAIALVAACGVAVTACSAGDSNATTSTTSIPTTAVDTTTTTPAPVETTTVHERLAHCGHEATSSPTGAEASFQPSTIPVGGRLNLVWAFEDPDAVHQHGASWKVACRTSTGWADAWLLGGLFTEPPFFAYFASDNFATPAIEVNARDMSLPIPVGVPPGRYRLRVDLKICDPECVDAGFTIPFSVVAP